MDICLFKEILEKIRPLIAKKNTVMHETISVHDRLCLTLQFLASGASYKDLMYTFRISVSTISNVVPEVSRALYNVLKQDYLSPPTTKH